MSEYREGCIHRKLVQSGAVESRTVPVSKKKRVDGPWLAVHWHTNTGRWNIWNAYAREEDACKIMNKMIGYWQMYVVHVDVFNRSYKPAEHQRVR